MHKSVTTGQTWAHTSLTTALVAGAFVALSLLERRFPLRSARERRARRIGRNLAIAGVGAVVLRALEEPIVRPLAARVAARGWGLVPRLPIAPWPRRVVAMLLLDYTLFVWHYLTHRVGFLWRFHAVHHADRELDASTALRFHFGELALSIPWRAAQVVLIGVDPATLSAWQAALLVSILFHHSNLGLAKRVDDLLSHIVVTPRLHGIHHSRRASERNSNWSSGLALWDQIHGTLLREVSQQSIGVGLRPFRRQRTVRLARMLALPFTRQAPS